MILIHKFGHALHSLIWFALIVVEIQLDFLAQHTAFGIDLVERNRVAVLMSFPKCRLAARERRYDADLDRVLGNCGQTQGCRNNPCGRKFSRACSH